MIEHFDADKLNRVKNYILTDPFLIELRKSKFDWIANSTEPGLTETPFDLLVENRISMLTTFYAKNEL